MRKIIELFEKDNFAKGCGIEIEEIKVGFARCSMKVTPNHLNGIGLLMGGALFTLADFTFSLAANSHGIVAVTKEASIAYLRKCTKGVVTAVATEIDRNDKSGSYAVEITGDDGEIVAKINGTTIFTGKKINVG
jgi:acyl-CoA thioesterase